MTIQLKPISGRTEKKEITPLCSVIDPHWPKLNGKTKWNQTETFICIANDRCIYRIPEQKKEEKIECLDYVLWSFCPCYAFVLCIPSLRRSPFVLVRRCTDKLLPHSVSDARQSLSVVVVVVADENKQHPSVFLRGYSDIGTHIKPAQCLHPFRRQILISEFCFFSRICMRQLIKYEIVYLLSRSDLGRRRRLRPEQKYSISSENGKNI